jgi:hypothetical protein
MAIVRAKEKGGLWTAFRKDWFLLKDHLDLARHSFSSSLLTIKSHLPGSARTIA